MPTESELLLTDDFLEFAEKIKVLAERKKQVKTEIQDRLALMKSLDEEAGGLKDGWTQFVAGKTATTGVKKASPAA